MKTAKPIIHGGDHRRGYPDYHPIPKTLIVIIDGLGSVITAGIKGDLTVKFDCDIVGWTLLADQAGDIVVDLWKADITSYPPTVADTITAAAQPTLSGSDHDDDTTLTGWTTSMEAGDTLRVHVDSAATVTRVQLALALQH